jgi:hypothetical protein
MAVPLTAAAAQVIAATVKGLRPAWLAPPEAQLPALQDMFLR